MPPVNTPAQRSPTGVRTPTHQSSGRPLTPLSYLSSPAPDLASTLVHASQAADEADEANVNFLRDSLESLDQASRQQQQQQRRSRVDPQRDPRRADYQQSHVDPQRDPRRAEYQQTSSGQRQQQQHQQDTAEDLSRRDRLQRVLSRLNRLHEPSASSTAAYTNRTPSPNRQSLYDWAPSGTARGEEQRMQEENELDAILRELRRQQPETHPDILRVLSQSQLETYLQRERDATGVIANAGQRDAAESAERRNRQRERDRRSRENEWVSLRSRAALQRARQEGAGSPSATERMLRYVMDRERSGLSEEEERARGTGWLRPSPTRAGNDDNNRGVNWPRDSWNLPPPANEWRDRDRQERVDAFRRGYLAENVPPRLPRISTPPVPAVATSQQTSSHPQLENALKYLSELRACTRYEEALSTAIDHGLATKEFFADKHDDFVMDLDEVPPLPYSSWLQPGTVFEGNQHATGGASLVHHGPNPTSHVEQINPNYRTSSSHSNPRALSTSTGFDHPPGSSRVAPFNQFITQNNASPGPSKESQHDQWPVRVVIHSIDAEKMTLQGTMEAYDVPQHPSSLSIINAADRPKAGKKNKPITTFLEGHIIDLKTHSFLTPSPDPKRQRPGQESADDRSRIFSGTSSSPRPDDIVFPSATPQTDAQNWLRLPPFSTITPTNTTTNSTSSISDKMIAHTLLTKSSLSALHNEYIFMRWKERCFVHASDDGCTASPAQRAGDQDRGHGLTISGFYYISLRRSDGAVEGLYFDPVSTPVQWLNLKGKQGGGVGAFGFR